MAAKLGKPGIIEILNRSGQVLQRFHHDGGEVRVGRAYDNDIIVGDPFVCPHHIRIRSVADTLVLEDLDSVNGTWNRKGRERIRKTRLRHGELVQFGHSQLRFQPVDSQLEPAWRDAARHGLISLMGRSWMLPLAGVLCILSLALERVIDSSRDLVPGVLANQMVYPLLGIMLWSGFWALLNQLIAHRANFRIHLAIASLGVAALFVLDQGVPLLGFALDWSGAVGWLKALGQIVILGSALIAHMQFATHGRTWVQVLGSVLLATMIFGIPWFGQLSQGKEFSSLPRLNPLLKPPAYKLVEGVGVDEFLERSDGLLQRLEPDQAD